MYPVTNTTTSMLCRNTLSQSAVPLPSHPHHCHHPSSPQLLQYHIVPGAAAKSTGLKNKQEIKTALAGANPLTVKIEGNKVEIEGDGSKPTDKDSADVVIADIAAGKAIIHVVDDVLIPAKLRKP
jgi:uncharacterized surface protein with fasciclin (FAS1) repeats